MAFSSHCSIQIASMLLPVAYNIGPYKGHSVEIEIYSHPYVTGVICFAMGVIAGALLRRKPRASVNTDLVGDRDEVNNIGGA